MLPSSGPLSQRERGQDVTIRALTAATDFARRLHRDEQGTISILTVFSLLMFTFLLVMVVNVATHLDDKVKMQNAADAGTYSGGVVLARGMNAIAFTNHLLCDVFALTAYLREAEARNAASLTPEILDEWQRTGQLFSTAEFEKFRRLGDAITDKVPKERTLVDTFTNLNAASSELTLPVLESILEDELIPEFQRAAVRTIPELAQRSTYEVALRNGLTRRELSSYPNIDFNPRTGRGPQTGILWRMNVTPVGDSDEEDPLARALPIVDPSPTGTDYAALPNAYLYFGDALEQRRQLGKHYLEAWTSDKLRIFDNDAEMSQFSNLWRIFTCAELDKLLTEEYPSTNLPFQLRRTPSGQTVAQLQKTGADPTAVRDYLETNYNFVGVAYRKHRRETGPGLFRNPLSANSDASTFAQVSLFIPEARWIYVDGSSANPNPQNPLGGAFGASVALPLPPQTAAPGTGYWVRENWPSHWDALNQNWTVQLVPATAVPLPQILQTAPPDLAGYRPPNLGGASIREIKTINTH